MLHSPDFSSMGRAVKASPFFFLAMLNINAIVYKSYDYSVRKKEMGKLKHSLHILLIPNVLLKHFETIWL